MAGIARVNIDRAGGRILLGGNSSVFANGAPIAVLKCPVAGHGDDEHSNPKMIQASGKVFASGIPVCRQGDAASCGHRASGSPTVFAG